MASVTVTPPSVLIPTPRGARPLPGLAALISRPSIPEPLRTADAAAVGCPGHAEADTTIDRLTCERDRLAADLARAAGVSLEVIRVRYGLLDG
jgi:hypothetical protein